MNEKEIMDSVNTELAVEVTQDLVRIPSIVEEEEEAGLYLEKKMKELGYDEVILQEVFPKRYNAIGIIHGKKPGKTMVLTGHMDNKPVCEGWTEDPFSGDLIDGCVHGHGVMDMKAGLCAQVAAGASLIEMDRNFSGDVVVAGVCDHMGPTQAGSVELFKKIKGDYCILGELTNSNLCLGHRGREYFDISTIGFSAHTCHKHDAINAIYTMLPLIEELSKLELKPDIDPYVKKLVGEELYTEVGRVFGGLWPGGPSMIPDRCTIRLDARLQPGVSFEYIENEVAQVCRKVETKNPKTKIEIVIADKKKPYLVSEEADVTKAVKMAMETVQKKPATIYAESWLADTASFGDLIETVLFGPGGDLVYMPNEFLAAKDIMEAAQIYTLSTLKLLGQ